MSKVFVTQYTSRQDFSKASEYGEVVFLTQEEYRPEPTPHGWNDVIYEGMRKKIMGYIPGEDYIITTGSSIPNVIVGMLLGTLTLNNVPHRGHNVLKWSNRKQGYELFKI